MQTQNIKKLFIKQWLWFFLLITLVVFLLLTYSGVSLSAFYLSLFYIKQTLNEFITNCYYLVGCIIYQIYMFVSMLLFQNQKCTTPQITQPLNSVSLSQKTQVNTVLLNSTNVTTNLFFLQRTLLSLSSLGNTCNTLVPNTSNNSNLDVNSGFLSKVNFLSTLSNNTETFKALGALNTETPYTLNSCLNQSFSNSLTFSTNLENLYTNDDSFKSDPILTETLTHNLNSTAKQQR